MGHDSYFLIITAASIGFFHTLLGPDHYVPFIVLAQARGWSPLKTAVITFLCGIGHVGSSIIIGFVGIVFGIALNRLVDIESTRGVIAAWMMIAFGLVYLLWGIKHSLKHKEHTHFHFHSDKTAHYHAHNHTNEHSHIHPIKTYKQLTPWILFTIFVFGPCEPFIPILLYPAATNSVSDIVWVTVIFTITTVTTMIVVVSLSLYGFRILPRINIERHMHAIAGATILICGIGIAFLGL